MSSPRALGDSRRIRVFTGPVLDGVAVGAPTETRQGEGETRRLKSNHFTLLTEKVDGESF